MLSLDKNIIKQALDLSPVATLIVDLKTRPQPVVYVNQAFEALSGYDAGELLGRPWNRLVGAADDTPEPYARPHEAVLPCHPRLGAVAELRLDLLPLYDGPGEPRFWLATETQQVPADTESNDEAEREALLAVLRDTRMHLRRLDGRDSVTGVLNGRAFDDLLRRDWLMARREGRSLALIAFRVDGFAAYRDVYGRHAADACVRKVAHAVPGALRRAGDLTGRLAEDRFVVLLGEADVAQADYFAAHIAERVRTLAIHHPRSPTDRYVTVSWGVASRTPDSGGSAAELVEAAFAAIGAEAAPGLRVSAG